MAKLTNRPLLALVALMACKSMVHCEDSKEKSSNANSDSEEEDIGALTPSTDAETTTLFPDFPDSRVPQSTSIDMLVGLANTGSRKFNVTRVWGALHSSIDYKYIMQNFSIQQPNSVVEPNEQGTFFYPFLPRVTEPRDYILTVNMLYEDDEHTKYRSTVYNATVEIFDPPGSVDVKQLLTYALLIAIAGGIGSLLYQWLAPKKKKVATVQSNDAIVEDDWASHTRVQAPGQGKKSKGKGKQA